MELNKIYHGDSLEVLKTFSSESIDCIITSPPYYGLRDYGIEGQIGQEKTPKEYISNLMSIMDECKRVLKKTGSLWVNIGEGFINQSLSGIPERFVISMIDNGWIRRNSIIWHKSNCMPSSVKSRFTIDFEYFYFFVKDPKHYYFETQYEPLSTATIERSKYPGVRIGSRNKIKLGGYGNSTYSGKEYHISPTLTRIKRCIWKIHTEIFSEAHFAIFPEKLIETPIKACCPPEGIVLDPFMGSGTVAVVAKKLGVNYIGIELNKEYINIAEQRLQNI